MARIARIYALNFQQLKVVELVNLPERGLVHITGPNGSGKTSLLSAAFVAFGSAKNAPIVPIRRGADEAEIQIDVIDTEDVKVTRRFWHNKNHPEKVETRLEVENKDGAVFRRGQEKLDSFWSPIAFDPLSFMRLDDGEQYDELRKLVPLAADIEALDEANKADYTARTDTNREARRLRDQAAGIILDLQHDEASGTWTFADGVLVPESKIDVDGLIREMQTAGETNASIERQSATRQTKIERIASLRSQAIGEEGLIDTDIAAVEQQHNELVGQIDADIAELEGRIVLLREQRAAAEEVKPGAIAAVRKRHTDKAAELRAAAEREEAEIAAPLPGKVDVEEIRLRITVAQQINAAVDQLQQRLSIEEQAAAKERAAAELTAAIERREAEKKAAIESAEMPVPGLGFEEGRVLMKGLPLRQASTAEQLRISVAIAAAMNPKLKFMIVREGVYLDDDSMALLAHLVEEAGYLCLIESIDPAGKQGYVLEEGEVAEVITKEIADQTRRPPRERRRRGEEQKQEGLL